MESKLLEALNVIKEVCEHQSECWKCPLGTELDDCKLLSDDTPPEEWNLAGQPSTIWRAFR